MRTGLVFVLLAATAAAAQSPKTPVTRGLEAGARLLQDNAPVAAMDIHLSGFHRLKDEPGHQMHAHHYCHQVDEDFAQCVLFDGRGAGARMTGIEYIVSARRFAALPADERRFWHPHNGEILAGQLVAPGIPLAAETALMKRKINSYGKTWHTWSAADALPLGPARLAWSFSRDGELDPALQARRDRELDVDTAARRRERAGLVPLAEPQWGVDDLGAAPGTTPIPGVRSR